MNSKRIHSGSHWSHVPLFELFWRVCKQESLRAQPTFPLFRSFDILRSWFGNVWGSSFPQGKCESELSGVEERSVYGMRNRFNYRRFGEEQDEDISASVSRYEARACQSVDGDARGACHTRLVGS
jgi:hypothetical protein